ncbi:MAG: hypothetical protein OHK0031_11600 [Anaerolineales bacterium]
MEILLNPNIAYLFFVIGTLLGLLALVTPGTGILEGAALLLLAAAGYAALTLGINPWALFALMVSVAPFLLALRQPRARMLFLLVTILLVAGGSIFLFTNASGQPLVHPLLALVVSLLSGGFLYLVVTKAVEIMSSRPVYDLTTLIGASGEAKSAIAPEGSAQVAGELWTARSHQPIAAGSRVRVVRRDGFTLWVEKIDE